MTGVAVESGVDSTAIFYFQELSAADFRIDCVRGLLLPMQFQEAALDKVSIVNL